MQMNIELIEHYSKSIDLVDGQIGLSRDFLILSEKQKQVEARIDIVHRELIRLILELSSSAAAVLVK